MWQTKRGIGLYSRYPEIGHSKKSPSLKIAVAIGGLLLGISYNVWSQQNSKYRISINEGDTVFIVCENLPVFSHPGITAGSAGEPNRHISFGEQVVVQTRVEDSKYDVVDSYPSSRKRQCAAKTGGSSRGAEEDACNPNKNLYEFYAWIGIKGGYIPANCLVHEWQFHNKQKDKRVGEEVTLQGAKGKAKKKNQGQAGTCGMGADGVVTLQGAKGKAKKKSQGQTCVQDLEEYLAAGSAVSVFSAEMETFLREAELSLVQQSDP